MVHLQIIFHLYRNKSFISGINIFNKSKQNISFKETDIVPIVSRALASINGREKWSEHLYLHTVEQKRKIPAFPCPVLQQREMLKKYLS